MSFPSGCLEMCEKLEGSIALSSGRTVGVKITIWAPTPLTPEEMADLEGSTLTLHMTPEPAVEGA